MNGEALRAYRERAGFTTDDLAGKLGLDSEVIGAIEQGGASRLGRASLTTLYKALGLTRDERPMLSGSIPYSPTAPLVVDGGGPVVEDGAELASLAGEVLPSSSGEYVPWKNVTRDKYRDSGESVFIQWERAQADAGDEYAIARLERAAAFIEAQDKLRAERDAEQKQLERKLKRELRRQPEETPDPEFTPAGPGER